MAIDVTVVPFVRREGLPVNVLALRLIGVQRRDEFKATLACTVGRELRIGNTDGHSKHLPRRALRGLPGGQGPANDFDVRFVVFATIGTARDERAVIELHRGAEAAALVARTGFRVEHDAVAVEVEHEAVVGLHSGDGAHAEGRLPLTDGEGKQEPLVPQAQDRHVHLAVVDEVANAIEGLRAVTG